MVKKGTLVFIITIVILLGGLNLYLFFNKTNISYSRLSGFAISDLPGVEKIPWLAKISENIDLPTLLFIAQWFLLVIILIVAYAKHKKHKKSEDVKISYNQIKSIKRGTGTDLDVFYDLLKNKKRLTMSVISKAFNISKEKALEWAKILENQELATIEYPAFNEPEVRIIQKEVEINEKEEKNKPTEKKEDKKDNRKKEVEINEKEEKNKPTEKKEDKKDNRKKRR